MSLVQAYIKNPTRSLMMQNKAAGQATTQKQLLDLEAGLAVPADSSSTPQTLIGVCNQSITADEALTQVPVIELFQNDLWIADTANNSNVLHNGQLMVLSTSLVVNNTGTTDPAGVVQQIDVFGAASARKILVRFIPA